MSDERRRAAHERNLENKARLAFASQTFRITTHESAPLLAESFEFEDRADFGLAFAERPFVAVGCIAAEFESLGDLDPIPVPVVTGFVTDWDQNENDLYVGAWCAATLTWPGEETVPPNSFEIQVDFTFLGIALKDVDPEVRT